MQSLGGDQVLIVGQGVGSTVVHLWNKDAVPRTLEVDVRKRDHVLFEMPLPYWYFSPSLRLTDSNAVLTIDGTVTDERDLLVLDAVTQLLPKVKVDARLSQKAVEQLRVRVTAALTVAELHPPHRVVLQDGRIRLHGQASSDERARRAAAIVATLVPSVAR